MRIMAWNCRGLKTADSPTIPFLGWIVRKFSPQILFLSETKSNASTINNLAMYLGFPSVATVDPINNAGGLAIFWCNDVNMEVGNSSTNHFACIINDVVDNFIYKWNLILLYGSPYIESRGEVWDRISHCLNQNSLDSVIIGDFNQVEFLSQKLGGSNFIPGKEQFSNWRSSMGLSEISFHGQPYTWCNNRSANDRIYERLDRAYATENWLHKNSEAMVLNLPILVSDHSPIILLTSPTPARKKTPIEMEAWCLDFKEISNIISEQWHLPVNGSPMFRIAQKSRHIRYLLFKWCEEYKKRHNISWEECLGQCGEVQASLPFINGEVLDEEIVNSVKEKFKYDTGNRE